MKRFIFSLLCLLTVAAVAQPPARRKTSSASQKTATEQTQAPKASGIREFPVAQAMPEDVAWRRDIYRQLDLEKDANAVLYYPTTPLASGQVNLFTYLFRLVLRGTVKAYKYTLDGNENFTEKNIVKAKDLMDTHHIYYESKDGKIRVADADIPSEDVKSYYVKESVYYDQHTATVRTKVTALCPILMKSDEFTGILEPTPLFWVRYDEAAPALGKLMLMGSNYNNAAMMSAADFFTLRRYDGVIYKTTNLQDRILAKDCDNDSTLRLAQQKVERELTDFERKIWGRKDSAEIAADSIAAARADSIAALKTAKKSSTTRRTSGASSRRSSASKSAGTAAKDEQPKAAAAEKRQRKSSTGSGKAGYSVRRQRR